jgi:hypothetical protein
MTCFTQIPNDILEALLTRDFHKRHLNIMFFVARLTYGCHQETCQLKASDFAGCGLLLPHVQQSLQELADAKILFLEQIPVSGIGKGYRKFYTIKINPDIPQWGIPPSLTSLSCLQSTLRRNLPKPYQNDNITETVMLQKSKEEPQKQVLQLLDKPYQNGNVTETVTLPKQLPYQNGKESITKSVMLSVNKDNLENELNAVQIKDKESTTNTSLLRNGHLPGGEELPPEKREDVVVHKSKKRTPCVLLSAMSGESQERWSKFLGFLQEGMGKVPDLLPVDFAEYHPRTPFLIATFLVARSQYDPRWRVRSRDLSGWFHDMDRLLRPEEERGDGKTYEEVRDVIEVIFSDEERPTTPKEFHWGSSVVQSVPKLREKFGQIEEAFFPNGTIEEDILPSWEDIKHVWE